MSDERLRQLERAAAFGDVEAGVQLIREKLRRGLIDEERLTLAAYLGDAAAQSLRPGFAPAEECDDKTWLNRLARWDRSITVRALYALALQQTVSLRAPKGASVVYLVRTDPKGLEVALEPDRPLVVGRDVAADVVVPANWASRRHCELQLVGDTVRVRDLESRNLTYVGGRPAKDEPLPEGVPLRIADTTFEIRHVASESLRTRCMDAVRAWLDDPSDATMEALHAAERALRARRDTVAHCKPALRAALAVLAHPPVTSTPDIGSQRLRQIVRSAILDWALWRSGPLPTTSPPPARLARFGSGSLGPHAAKAIEDELELRVESIFDEQPDLFTVRGAEGRERLTIVHGEARDRPYASAAWEALRHPNLTRVLGSGHLAYERFYLREREPGGESLLSWRARTQPAPRDVAHLMLGVAEGVNALVSIHEQVYLSPRYVSVRADGSPVLHGLLGETLERYHEFEYEFHHRPAGMGDLAYISPEEATERASAVPATMAVYRLGAVFYAALVGHPPFIPRSARVLLQILDAAPPPPSTLIDGLSPHLEAIALKALAKNPDDRHASPAAFAAELREALGDVTSGA